MPMPRGHHVRTPPEAAVLQRLYVIERKSTTRIAAIYAVSNPTVARWLREVGIAIRTLSEAGKGRTISKLAITRSVESRRTRKNKGRPVGYKFHRDGYVSVHVPGHPRATKQGYVYEHRLSVEKKLGRFLTRAEVVHHVNGVRDDNRIENLELKSSQAEHIRGHCDPVRMREMSREGVRKRWLR